MTDKFGTTRWPNEIRLRKADKLLAIDFDDGVSVELPAELLRGESPSAEVQGHSAAEKKIIAGRRHVGIMEIEPVGNYAIRILFDDLHDTGIFSWQYLYELGVNLDRAWRGYLAALEEAGLSRDP